MGPVNVHNFYVEVIISGSICFNAQPPSPEPGDFILGPAIAPNDFRV